MKHLSIKKYSLLIAFALSSFAVGCGRADSTDLSLSPPKELNSVNNITLLFGTWKAETNTVTGEVTSVQTLHFESPTVESSETNMVITKVNKCGDASAEVTSPIFVSANSIRFPKSTSDLVGNCESSLVASTSTYKIVGSKLTINHSLYGGTITYTKVSND